MYAQLGDIVFEGLYGFDALTRRREMRYARHELVDGKPRLQRTGAALDTLSVGIRLNSQFMNPEANLRRLAEAQRGAEPLTLVLGNGAVAGDFVIESIDEVTEKTDAEGNIVAARVELALLEYFDPNKPRARQAAAEAAAFALDRNRPEVVNIPAPAQAPAETAAHLTATGAEAGAINSDVGKLEAQVSDRPRLFARIRAGADKMGERLESYRSGILAGMAEYRNAQEILDSINETQHALSSLRAAADLENVTTALDANRSLQEAMNGTERSSSGFVAQIATRRL